MAIKIARTCLPIIFILASFFCCSDSSADKILGERRYYTPIQYLKNYALSACIADGYQAKEVVNDATAAANGYKELGGFSIDAYNEAATLDSKFLAKIYLGKDTQERLILMKCIDYYHSEELDQLIRKYQKIDRDLAKEYENRK